MRFLAVFILCFGVFCAANAGENFAKNAAATQDLALKNAQFLAQNPAQILAQNSPQTPEKTTEKTPAQQLQNQLAATLANAEQICLDPSKATSFRAQICQKVGLLYELATPPQPAAAKQYLNFACELAGDRGECHLYYAHAYETGSPLAKNPAAAREFYAIACKKGAAAACGK